MLQEKAKTLDKTVDSNHAAITKETESLESSMNKFKEEVKVMEASLMAR